MSEKELKTSRIAYISQIMYKVKMSQGTLMPTATEERFYQEALKRVVHLVSSKEHAPPAEGTFSSDMSVSNRVSDTKQCLKKIVDELYSLERSRLYDPPSDNEIGHYLLIQKYTRSILAFHLAAAHSLRNHEDGHNFFRSVSLFVTKNYVENIMAINQHLADLSEFCCEKSIEDVTPLTPWMQYSKDRHEMKPLINGSKEKSHMFYKHKFNLALADLRSSEFAYCPPFEDEERSYLQALDAISAPLIRAEDQMNVFSEELFSIYLDWIHQHIIDIERYFEQIKCWILKNLSLVEWWEANEKDVIERITMFRYGLFANEEDEDISIAEFPRELSEGCQVPNEDLPDYISNIDRCLTVTLLVDVLTDAISWDHSRLRMFKLFHKWKQAGWEAVHALTLFKHGSPVGCGLQEQPILRNTKIHVPLVENQQATRKLEPEHILHTKGQDENVVILEGVITALKSIGDSEMVLDEEEMGLVHKIWGNVASATHFYVSAMAYEQKRYVTQHCDSFDVSMLKLPAAEPKETIDLKQVRNWKLYMKDSINNFVQFLIAFKTGLEEKLKSS